MKKNFIWQNPEWMNFKNSEFKAFNGHAEELSNLENSIAEILLVNELAPLVARAMVNEITSNNGIEGIKMDSSKLRSSIARSLGLVNGTWEPVRQETGKEEKAVKAALRLLNGGTSLTITDIIEAHAMLGTGAQWGKLRNHSEHVYDENNISVYTTPPPAQVVPLINRFIEWWATARNEFLMPVASALSHFLFVTIHPFLDGNGRISRMIADKALIRNANTFRFYSMSHAIEEHKYDYYDVLNRVQTCQDDISAFVDFMLKIQQSALEIAKARANKLVRIRNFINITAITFNQTEKDVIYEMALGERQYWSMFEATRYMEDGDAAQEAWNNLISIGVIKDGMLDLTNLTAEDKDNVPTH